MNRQHTRRSDARDAQIFDLSAGALCLDFANTLRSRLEAPVERLATYDDLVDWGVQAELLTAGEAKRLRAEARAHPRRAAAALGRARETREAIFEVFAAAASGDAVPVGALDALNERLPPALSALRLTASDGGYGWTWSSGSSLDRVVWPVLRSAADLLVSGELERVRECAAEDCRWLFLDQSRNRSRRWCDMAVCGNRTKVRRFRESV